MNWGEKLVGIVTSRWMQGLYFGILCIAVWSRSRGWWIAACVAAGTLIAGLLLGTVPALRQINRAWRDYPNTPEAEEYARRKRKELENEDKNKIELE